MEQQTLVAVVGLAAMLAMMLLRVPIGVCLGVVGVAGFAWLNGWGPALGLLIYSPIRTGTDFNFSVIPLSPLRGGIVSRSGMRRELFRAPAVWLGHLPGGMAMATVFACGGVSAVNRPARAPAP